MTRTPRTPAGRPPVPVDETFHPKRYGCYELTRVYHVDGHVLRVWIYRDFYDFQSHAVAEVLTPQHTWAVVATAPWTQWHHTTPSATADAAPLTSVADDLLRRARRILNPPPSTPSPAAAPADR
ncbi:hypothetical protein ACNTMW_18200 [Planosporangium sp. 12N6]|uniref:hypothetical protein n=1 Tax=Planosporangium spinosum TaxID=3402278 RepID=UPI003CF77EBD